MEKLKFIFIGLLGMVILGGLAITPSVGVEYSGTTVDPVHNLDGFLESSSVCYDHWSVLNVVETITDLGGGVYKYSYAFTNTETSSIWHFGVWTTFSAGTATQTTFSGMPTTWNADGHPIPGVGTGYDARNLDPNITWVSHTWDNPWPSSPNPIAVGASVSGFSYHANVLDTSPKYYYYEIYGSNLPGGCVTAVGLIQPSAILEVDVDIKPQSCPNPLNVTTKGVVPVAILGTESFDANNIDIASIRLEGVAPLRSSLEDVATPVVVDFVGDSIAYWSFDDTSDPGHDDSGNGHNGTVYGAISADGICGKALSFDGIDDGVSTTLVPPTGSSPRTIMFWAKTTESTRQMIGTSYGGDPWDSGGSFRTGFNHRCEGVTIDVSMGAITYSATVSDGEWHSYTWVVPEGATRLNEVKVYMDGIQLTEIGCWGVSFDRVINTSSTFPFEIGAYYSDFFFEGVIDEVRIYDRALSANEIEDLADPTCDGKRCECSTEGPDGYDDLTLKFKTQEIVEELVNSQGELVDGEVLALILTGVLSDETPIEGADCVLVLGKVPKPIAAKRSDINGDGIVNIIDLGMIAEYWLESTVLDE